MTKQRVALVTGAGQGIGLAISLRLARDGFDVAVSDGPRTEEAVAATCREIQALGRRATAVIADVMDAGQISAMVAKTVARIASGIEDQEPRGFTRVPQITRHIKIAKL